MVGPTVVFSYLRVFQDLNCNRFYGGYECSWWYCDGYQIEEVGLAYVSPVFHLFRFSLQYMIREHLVEETNAHQLKAGHGMISKFIYFSFLTLTCVVNEEWTKCCI
jgi:hypothetical protein